MDKREIKQFFQQYQRKPIKYWGQNFLIDRKFIQKIIKAAQINKKSVILEIGPGLGSLTLELAKKAKQVIAIEKDSLIYSYLQEKIKNLHLNNIILLQQDIRKTNLKIINGQLFLNNQIKLTANYKIVANLPFYLTAPVIRKFLESPQPPHEMILVVQKEVAQRICSQPPQLNLLALSVQFYAHVQIISSIPPQAFWPKPKVSSAIIKIKPKTTIKKISPQLTQQFFTLIKAGFSHPRKQLLNNLSNKLKLNKEKTKFWLLQHHLLPSQRAESLSLKKWLILAKDFWQNREKLL